MKTAMKVAACALCASAMSVSFHAQADDDFDGPESSAGNDTVHAPITPPREETIGPVTEEPHVGHLDEIPLFPVPIYVWRTDDTEREEVVHTHEEDNDEEVMPAPVQSNGNTSDDGEEEAE